MKVPFLDLTSLHSNIQAELDLAWQEVNQSGRFIGGPAVEAFEKEWAAYCGTGFCVGLASGTAALELALRALDVGTEHEVIVPANTFFATAAAVRTVGATPVFVDVDPDTLLITADIVERAISERTGAIIVVHLYGQMPDVGPINEVAKASSIPVIEDAAQAHGATWQNRRAGSVSDIGCFSFYPGKNLGAFGDAGAVVSDNEQICKRVRSLSNHGRSGMSHYHHEHIGGTHRLDAVQASILSVKLRYLDTWNSARRQVATWYEEALSGLPIQLVHPPAGTTGSNHLAVILSDRRDHLRARLEAEGVQTQIHYPIPCHLQPALEVAHPPVLPVSEGAAKRLLSLPMGPTLSFAEVTFVAEAVRRAVED